MKSRRVTVVGLCVCVSVKSHLTSGMSVFLENIDRSQKIVGFSLKPLRCRGPALPPLKAIRTVGYFPVESVHAH